MRKDYFTLELRDDGGDDEKPTLALAFDGPAELIENRLTDATGEPLTAEEIDVVFRYTTPVEADDAAGVLSLTNRLTGEFVLETDARAETVLSLVQAAKAATPDGGEDTYRIVVERDADPETYEKRTLLVYDEEGDLRRGHSLIPGGVEL